MAKGLKKYFRTGTFLSRRSEQVRAVDGVSMEVNRGEIVGLAGESGCGKTTLGRLLLRLEEPDEGEILFEGEDILRMSKGRLRETRPRMQIIFQNPYASLNPRKTILASLERPLIRIGISERDERIDRTLKLLSEVELNPPDQFLDRFPHELSGGQRQRVCIARAIAGNPSFIVADESVSSLDISVRAQVLSIIKKLKREHVLSVLFITHDLSVLRSIADRVAIMYLGKIVEIAKVDDLFKNPLHPYTHALLLATPVPNPDVAKGKRRPPLRGEPPSPIRPPSGCAFHPRCPRAQERCSSQFPDMKQMGEEHYVACYYPLNDDRDGDLCSAKLN